MRIKKISSLDNQNIRKLKKLLSKSSYRHQEKLFVIEGKRSVFDIDEDNIIEYYMSESFFNEESRQFNRMINVLDDDIFNKLSDTKNSQGIIALAKFELYDVNNINEVEKILILDRISDPGNMGTIIRTSEASGVDLIVCINGCVDIYNPKVVRSTMGSITRQKIIIDAEIDDVLKKVQYNKIPLLVTTLNDSVDIEEVDKLSKYALVVGSESVGVCNEFIDNANLKIKLPMKGKIESLNVAVASGILLYKLTKFN